ncbi:hypothetical protein SARC_00391 [Sphaeroforma arctica JP610]|uniref:Uncharacterized protein n=1 Tax=Sphaeroforma arctica JP610 TaxID=667725 RepID=A0A0L0GF62_9EUKA|nr:hypothetical protein SARC_00391 [Sphaeroforma arctica JP610]KNC87506.1 hypothetical protein SARC_00391 [Sphaeroforma arctica JP610]|eukprot:XP_014161408.1 hypothetical protein SARC_00391 [Sphaeroforma arctica JP610]
MGAVSAYTTLGELYIYELKVTEKAYAALKKASISGIDRIRIGIEAYRPTRYLNLCKSLTLQGKSSVVFAYSGYGCERDPKEARRIFQRYKKFASWYSTSFPDTEIGMGSTVCSYEKESKLSIQGLSMEERNTRYLRYFMDTCTPSAEAESDVSTLPDEKVEMLNHLRKSLKSTATHKQPTMKPIVTTTGDTTLECIRMRAKAGFCGAQDYMKAVELSNRVLDRLMTTRAQDADECLADLREVTRLSDILPFSANEIRMTTRVAMKRLDEENWMHADTSFYLVRNINPIPSIREMVDRLSYLVELHPEDADITRLLGRAYKFAGIFHLSSSFFCRALELESDRTDLYYKLGAAYRLRADKTQEAIDAFVRFIKDSPSDHRMMANAHYSLGFLHLQLPKDIQNAKKQYQKGSLQLMNCFYRNGCYKHWLE